MSIPDFYVKIVICISIFCSHGNQFESGYTLGLCRKRTEFTDKFTKLKVMLFLGKTVKRLNSTESLCPNEARWITNLHVEPFSTNSTKHVVDQKLRLFSDVENCK